MVAGGDMLTSDPTAWLALTNIHTKPITDCCFSPDTRQVVTGSEDGLVVVWDLPDENTELHDETVNIEHKLVCFRLAAHSTEPITSVDVSRRVLLSASRDGQVKIWSMDINKDSHRINTTRKPEATPKVNNCHRRIIRSARFSQDASVFATASDDTSVRIWSTECINKTLISFMNGHANWVKCVRWSQTDDRLLASCGDDSRICIWDMRQNVRQATPSEIIHATRRRLKFNCLEWHPVFGHYLATGSQDGSCIVWDLRMRREVQIYAEHTRSVNSVAFDQGGSLLLSGSSDKSCKIFNVCEGQNMFTLLCNSEPITSVCFNKSSDMFAAASQDKTVTMWNKNFETVKIVPTYEDDHDDTQEDINETVSETNAFNDSCTTYDYDSTAAASTHHRPRARNGLSNDNYYRYSRR